MLIPFQRDEPRSNSDGQTKRPPDWPTQSMSCVFVKRLNAAWCPRQTRTIVNIGIYAIYILQCIYIYIYIHVLYIYIYIVTGLCLFWGIVFSCVFGVAIKYRNIQLFAL